MLTASSFYIFTNIIVLNNFDNGMDKVGWNFYNSRIIAQKGINPIFNEVTGMTHLYFDNDFIKA